MGFANEKLEVVECATNLSIESQPTKKSEIIDYELNRHGMGRYQWLIWSICGTGFFLDIMWFQALSLAWPNIQHEFGFSDKEFGNIFSAFNAGLAVGAFTWGVLVDVVGRKLAFIGTSLIAGIFGTCLGAQSSYIGLLLFTGLTGVGIGGNVPVDSTITVEYLPQSRFYLLAGLTFFQPPAFLISSLIGFAFVPNFSCPMDVASCHLTGGTQPCCSRDANMGWRYMLFAMGVITLCIFITRTFLFPFYESPKFLLAKGNDHAAVEVVRKIAVFNRRPCDLTVESLHEGSGESPVAEEMGVSKRLANEALRLKQLFGSWKMMRVTILIWITWMFDYWGISIAFSYLPTILERKNGALEISLKQTYIDYLIIFSPGLVAVALAVLMVRAPMVGRKWTLVFSSMLAGASLFLFSVVNTEASHVGFNMLEYFSQTLFNAVLFGWTPEAFPAAVRGTATGLASFFGSLLAICAPLVGAQLFSSSGGSDAVLYLGGSGTFVCTIAILLLPARDMLAPR